MLTSLVDRIQTLPAGWVYAVVGLLVFAEDAIFVGFVIPGETATVLGGVLASRGHVSVVVVAAVVVAAAIAGDQVGFTIGQRIGPRFVQIRGLRSRRTQVERAQGLLARKGGAAVFGGRFVAFFRAVMPALAGASGMHRRTFALYNAAGGIVWGVGFVLVGYLAGNSYGRVEKLLGRGFAVAAVVVVLAFFVGWRVRRSRRPAADDGR